ncbi:hypothetical protein GCM10023081_43200 [Arthrobacter ginkgonis]|uniref:2-keto-4-pentenoate hydratase n=2 Tax=Arthrobacter ginkgonis TaxID=1630594 RepID=A0ABP7DBS9_9MICC
MRPWDEAPKFAALAKAANILYNAQLASRPGPPIADLLSPYGIEGADEARMLNLRRGQAEGRRVAGRIAGKARAADGLPEFGYLFADTIHADGATLPGDQLTRPQVAASIGFVLGTPLEHADTTPAELFAATAYVVPVLLVLSSRTRGDGGDPLEHVADNTGYGHVVLGSHPVRLADAPLHTIQAGIQVLADGAPLTAGPSRDAVPALLGAMAAIRRSIKAIGPVAAGEVVVGGPLTDVLELPLGATANAALGPLGSVGSTHVAAAEIEGFEPLVTV